MHAPETQNNKHKQICPSINIKLQSHNLVAFYNIRPGRGVESESLCWRRHRLRVLSVSSGVLCDSVAVYL